MPDVPSVQVHATDSTSEVSIEVNVESAKFAEQPWEAQLIDSNLTQGGSVVTGTRYKELSSLVGQDYAARFGDYILTDSKDRYAGFITLLFAKNKDSTVDGDPNNPNTPIRVNIETKPGHYWHPILKELKFIPVSYGFSQTGFNSSGKQGVQTAQRYLIRQVYIPGTSEGTRFVTSVFQSPTPFQIPQWDVPLPTEVSFHYINLSGGFPSCLHKRLALEDLLGSTGFSGPAGSSAADYELIKGQVFPATNFIDWQPYVLSDSQELVNGVWVRTQVKVYPPDQPRVITKIS